MSDDSNRKAYIIGGGIAGLATAVFLITDGGMKGENIFIYDQNPESGGSLDGQGTAEFGYLSRGYRMYEDRVYPAMFDLLSKIPSLDDQNKTLKEEFYEFNDKNKIKAKARLMDGGRVIDSYHLGLNWKDRLALIKLIFLSEKNFGTSKISDYFTVDFFKTNFWFEWATIFSFEPWHSLVEMKRYLVRFVHRMPDINTISCLLSSPYSEHDFMVLPLVKWLKVKGVNFEQNKTVLDLNFTENKKQKLVTGFLLQEEIKIDSQDLVFLTTASITEGSKVGSMVDAPKLQTKKRSLWNLWRDIAGEFDDLGQPDVFCISTNKTRWESFTITFSNSVFVDLVEKLTSNKAGTGGPITFKNSNWLLSIFIPHQPYFRSQPSGVFICGGYGLISDEEGNYIKKKMTECGGEELLKEVCFHLGLVEQIPEIIKSAICIPVIMPYITSQFSPRKKTDRPEVVPKGSVNFACIGQYVEIPNEITFTVEQSVRSAKIAVKKLLKLKNKIPPIYQGKYNPWHVIRAIMTILR